MEYNEIVDNKDILLKKLKKFGGQRPLARELGCDHKALKYWMDKYGIKVSDYKDREIDDPYSDKAQNGEDKKGEDEVKSKVDEHDDYYVIHSETAGPFIFTKEEEKLFRKMYCPQNSKDQDSINRCARELEMSRAKLYAAKTALGITHDSLEFTEDEIKNNDEEVLTERALLRKKNRIAKNIEKAEYKKAIKENRKYREQDYIFKKHTNRLIDALDKIDYRAPYLYEIGNEVDKPKTMVINISDWHKGKKVLNEKILGNNSYNKELFDERVHNYLQDIIRRIELQQPERLYILNYGDGPDGPDANVYEGQVYSQDTYHEEQVMDYVDTLKEFILALYDYQPDIFYSGVPGNHSDEGANWDVVANMMLKRMFADYETIQFDVEKSDYKIHEIYDYYLVIFHGNQLTKKLTTPTAHKQVLGMLNLENLPFKRTYLCQGHLHHRATEGPNYRRLMLPSMVGSDTLSSNKMQTGSRPAQSVFLMEEGKGLTEEYHTFFDLAV